MCSRLGKIALVFTCALFHLIVVLNNTVFDYGSNYAFVQHVLSMDTLFSGESQTWRALRDPTPEDGSYWLHHGFYWIIIGWEASAGVLCFLGSWQLWKARREAAIAFQKAKALAVTGLTISLLLWFLAFITVGGEWFLMWQSSTWNGQTAAARMFTILGIVLIFLVMPDPEPGA